MGLLEVERKIGLIIFRATPKKGFWDYFPGSFGDALTYCDPMLIFYTIANILFPNNVI
jgi:hypothetical protein